MISVIIPVHNTPERDLRRCIDSVLNSTYKNLQILLIDDGSEPPIASFLDEIAILDKRIEIFHESKNRGVSYARNLGISKAIGDFICFVDSDDELNPLFFEEAMGYIHDYQLDMVIGSTCFKDNDNITLNKCNDNNNLPYLYEANENEKTINLLLDYMVSTFHKEKNKELQNILLGRVYPKITKASIVKTIKFDTNINLHEDNLFSYDLINKCERIGVVEKVWYNYNSVPYSIVHQKHDINKIETEILFAHQFYQKKKLAPDILHNAINIRITLTLINICMYLRSKELLTYRKEVINRIFNDPIFTDAIKNCNLKEYENISHKQRFLINLIKMPKMSKIIHILLKF